MEDLFFKAVEFSTEIMIYIILTCVILLPFAIAAWIVLFIYKYVKEHLKILPKDSE